MSVTRRYCYFENVFQFDCGSVTYFIVDAVLYNNLHTEQSNLGICLGYLLGIVARATIYPILAKFKKCIKITPKWG
jgi:hypothetical protein